MSQHDAIKDPPATLLGSLRFLGPGLILSAAVVGSGELIATTVLGAQAGFILLWVILLACFVKVALQVEYGRQAILSGRSSFAAWNEGGGMRVLGLHWSLLFAFAFLLTMFVGQGGVIGGAVEIAHHEFPALSVTTWTLILAVGIALMIFHGMYQPVEWLAIVFNALFLGVLLVCLIRIQRTDYAFSFADVVSGLTFHLPPEGAVKAASAFGIVGIGAGEMVIYSYWCLEKGYAAWSGPNDGSEAWRQRARGWIRVMSLDAIVSMVAYTVSTCAFYLLGAAILPSQETLAQGNTFIFQLSLIFTEILGKETRALFMLGAFMVLFSTAFANTAGFARLWTDFLILGRWVDAASRRKAVAVLAWLLPISWGLTYLGMKEPVWMILFMGIANTAFLVIVAYKALVFRYRMTDSNLKPPLWYDGLLWIGFLSISAVGLQAFYMKWMG